MSGTAIHRISAPTRVLFGLFAGIAIGLSIAGTTRPTLLFAASASETVGTLWLNAIRMTVLPLVASLLISRIADRSGSVGRVGTKAFVLFVLLATAGAAFTAIVAPYLIALLPLDPDMLEGIRAQAVAPATDLPPFRDWLTGLIPPNPLKVAVDGALLPFVVFTICFALAAGRTAEKSRVMLVQFFDAVTRTMFVLIGWINSASPVGVFGLALSLAARGGAGLASALGFYVAVVCLLLAAATLLLYPLVTVVARVSLVRFARACAPVQAIAFSTRSSFASLPVLIDRAEHELHISPDVSGLVLPIAVSVFKFAMPISRLAGTCFVARLFGIPLMGIDVFALAAALVVGSFYTPGIPSGSLFVLAPIYESLGLPIAGIGLLLAADLVPDMFQTTCNITADMAVATLVSGTQRMRIE